MLVQQLHGVPVAVYPWSTRSGKHDLDVPIVPCGDGPSGLASVGQFYAQASGALFGRVASIDGPVLIAVVSALGEDDKLGFLSSHGVVEVLGVAGFKSVVWGKKDGQAVLL